MNHLEKRLGRQRAYFDSGATRPLSRRETALRRLLRALDQSEGDLLAALERDLGKHPFEGYETEVGLVRQHLRYTLAHLHRWARPKLAAVSPLHFPAGGFIRPEPRGLVLIIAPWNYPVQLCLIPLIDAIAAGNCAVLKPSEGAPATAQALCRLLRLALPEGWASCVPGGVETTRALLAERFDYIFFTGGQRVGKIVMRAAAEHLTPVTLELGGKSPCIVAPSADIPLAARRILWGKLLGAGQTCVAPDYLLVHRSVKEALVAELRRQLALLCPDFAHNKDYPRLVSERAFDRLAGLLIGRTPLVGGGVCREERRIEPTVIEAEPGDPLLKEELFGPLLPLVCFDRLGDAIRLVRAGEKSLALYLFTRSAGTVRRVCEQLSFGGGCVNDTVVQMAGNTLPFGGVGASGMGRYHGPHGFLAMSHQKPVVLRGQLALPVRYPPYGEKLDLLKLLLR